MNLEEGLAIVAGYFSLDVNKLIEYAAEDAIGGYHENPALRKWGVGSLWEVEGKILYAFIRATNPSRVLEIGTSQGASATHMLTAMERNNQGGLTSLDINAGAGYGIPQSLRSRWRFMAVDAVAYLENSKEMTGY